MYSNNLSNTDICTEFGVFDNFEVLLGYMKDFNYKNVKGQANYWGTYTFFDLSLEDLEKLVQINKEEDN